MIITVISLGLFTAWPAIATPPYTAIIIESGSPYSSRSQPPSPAALPSDGTIPQLLNIQSPTLSCLEDGNALRIRFRDRPAQRQRLHFPGWLQGTTFIICRIHPIMHGVIIVTDAPSCPSQT